MAEFLIGGFAWAAATALGMRLLRIVNGPRFAGASTGVVLTAAEKIVMGSAIGLGALACLFFLLGSLGFLDRIFWVLILGVIFSICVSEFTGWRGSLARQAEPLSWTFRSAAVLAGLAMLGSLFGALAPAVGQDELCYHLSQPANYLREGRVYEVPFATSSLWPYLMEMLFTLGVVLRNESVAKFFHWAMTWTAAGSIYCFARRMGAPREESGWGALIFLAAPAVFIQSSFAYVDSTLAAYTVLSMMALVVALREGSARWAALAGIFSGLAASTKLLGLFAVILGAAAVASALRSGLGGRVWRQGVIFFAAAFLAGAVWYIRAWVLRGNPFFPFYSEWFNGMGWHDPTYVNAHGRPGILGFFTFPWDLTMYPVWFGGEAPGPLFLMFAPAAFLFAPPLRVRLAAAFGILFSVLWFKVDPNARFFFPALAFFSVPAGYAVSRMIAGKAASAVLCRTLLLAIFASSAVLGVYHFHNEAESVLRGDRDSYLRRYERSFAAAQAVNAQLAPGDRVLSAGESRGYSFNLKHPFVLEGDFINFTKYSEKAASAEDVVSFWRQSGFTHVLSSDLNTVYPDPLRASSILADPNLRQKFFNEQIVVRSGGVRYVLYRIL